MSKDLKERAGHVALGKELSKQRISCAKALRSTAEVFQEQQGQYARSRM